MNAGQIALTEMPSWSRRGPAARQRPIMPYLLAVYWGHWGRELCCDQRLVRQGSQSNDLLQTSRTTRCNEVSRASSSFFALSYIVPEKPESLDNSVEIHLHRFDAEGL